MVHVHSIYRFPLDITIVLSFLKKQNIVFSPHGSLDPYLFNRSDNKLFGIFCKKLIHFFLHYPLKHVLFHFTAQDI